MGASFALKLSLGCVLHPFFTVKFRDITVYGLADYGTGADGPVALVREAVLIVSFIQDTCPDSIEFFN